MGKIGESLNASQNQCTMYNRRIGNHINWAEACQLDTKGGGGNHPTRSIDELILLSWRAFHMCNLKWCESGWTIVFGHRDSENKSNNGSSNVAWWYFIGIVVSGRLHEVTAYGKTRFASCCRVVVIAKVFIGHNDGQIFSVSRDPRSREPCECMYFVYFTQRTIVCNSLQRGVGIETTKPSVSWGRSGGGDVSWDVHKRRTYFTLLENDGIVGNACG